MEGAPHFPLPTAAYIHVPFCRHRCGYCDFTLVAGKDHLIDRYLAALEKDLQTLGTPRPVQTVFLGGGTPSHLSPSQSEKLLGLLARWFPLVGTGEYSLEANPLDLTSERLAIWRQQGVNRVSLGIQSFEDSFLQLLERDHRRKEIYETYDLLQKYGFQISLDLIFGLPEQSLSQWESTLREATALNPAHISTYGLTFEKGTSFWNRRAKGELHSIPDELEREMYALAMDLLPELGYPQYEISNFSQPGSECRHNGVYWSGDSYYGHGPGAARYLHGTRATNHRSVINWISRLERGDSPIGEEETLSHIDRARELLFLGLRRVRGIQRHEFHRRTGLELDDLVGATIDKHQQRGLIEDDGICIRLTREGRFLADSVIGDYLVSD